MDKIQVLDEKNKILSERIKALEKEVEEKEKTIKFMCLDWADDDTRTREIAAKFIPQKKIDGDSYFMPNIVDLFEELAKIISNYKEGLDGLGLKPTWEGKFWCAFCGEWGNHQSGWCPKIKSKTAPVER